MESYVSDLTSWAKETPGELQKFIDRMAEMLERPQQPADEELAQIVRALPSHLVQNFSVREISSATPSRCCW